MVIISNPNKRHEITLPNGRKIVYIPEEKGFREEIGGGKLGERKLSPEIVINDVFEGFYSVSDIFGNFFSS